MFALFLQMLQNPDMNGPASYGWENNAAPAVATASDSGTRLLKVKPMALNRGVHQLFIATREEILEVWPDIADNVRLDLMTAIVEEVVTNLKSALYVDTKGVTQIPADDFSEALQDAIVLAAHKARTLLGEKLSVVA